jgi:hypothetical protein
MHEDDACVCLDTSGDQNQAKPNYKSTKRTILVRGVELSATGNIKSKWHLDLIVMRAGVKYSSLETSLAALSNDDFARRTWR